jgi:hypothetical protein
MQRYGQNRVEIAICTKLGVIVPLKHAQPESYPALSLNLVACVIRWIMGQEYAQSAVIIHEVCQV